MLYKSCCCVLVVTVMNVKNNSSAVRGTVNRNCCGATIRNIHTIKTNHEISKCDLLKLKSCFPTGASPECFQKSKYLNLVLSICISVSDIFPSSSLTSWFSPFSSSCFITLKHATLLELYSMRWAEGQTHHCWCHLSRSFGLFLEVFIWYHWAQHVFASFIVTWSEEINSLKNPPS